MSEAAPMTEDEIITLIAREWLTAKGVSEESVADLSSPEEFPLVAPEDWAACREVARAVLHRIATALSEAEARGRRQGLEEAAKAAEMLAVQQEARNEAHPRHLASYPAWALYPFKFRECASAIRSLATAPAETQKPEETA